MGKKVSVLVITGYGTNCEKECAYVAKIAGADSVDICHFSDLVEGNYVLEKYNFIIFPGGFLDGDDLGAAQAAAQRWHYTVTKHGKPLITQLLDVVGSGGVLLGICNGFQLLVKLGLLPAISNEYLKRKVSLTHNASARYEDRWCYLKVNSASPCIFTKGLTNLYLPVRHGEGRLVPQDLETLENLKKHNLIPVQYADPINFEPTEEYPANPNGSPIGIAGLCDPTGRIFGLMPHPEAYNHKTNHPMWTREDTNITDIEVLGTELFANAVKFLKS